MSLISTSSKIVGGSALAGFGLSIGRDVYKGTKKNSGQLILALLLMLAIFTLYMTSIWFFRNYRSFFGGMIKRIGAAIFFVPSYFVTFAGLYTAIYIPVAMLDLEMSFVPLEMFSVSIADYVVEWRSLLGEFLSRIFTSVGANSGNEASSIGEPTGLRREVDQRILLAVFLLQHLIIFSGVLSGLRHRRKRQMAWTAEDHNSKFLHENGIEELDETHFRDSLGNRYRLHNVFLREIELFAEGKRNRRAYIQVDEAGKFTSWRGLTSIS